MENKHLSRQRRWQLKQRQAGKCVICGGELATKTHCAEHQAAHSAWQRLRYRLAKAGV